MTDATKDKVIDCPFPYKRILVFPERTLRASLLEMAMIDTRIMQRLRNTKELGNSNVSYPTADHSRFAHSLGVLYWSTKILTSLNDNHNAEGNTKILKIFDGIIKKHLQDKLPSVKRDVFNEDKYLGVSWFEQLVRLYALLHDLSHIPYGHTLEDQAQVFTRHDEDLPRLDSVFEMLKKEVNESYHFEKLSMTDDDIAKIAIEYIELVKKIFVMGTIISDPDPNDKHRSEWIERWKTIDPSIYKPLLLSYDIVSNTICADLMDYTLRDTLFASMPKTFDKALLTSMKIVEYKTIFYDDEKKSDAMLRLGVNISRKKVRHDIITAILDLLRIRYDLTEKVYYHHTKVITDIMLEKIIRSLPTKKRPLGYSADEVKLLSFTPENIYERYLGDEGFLILLEDKLKSTDKLFASSEILNKILRRNLYKTVFRINRNEALSPTGRSILGTCDKPVGRDEVEHRIVTELADKHGADIKEGDIIISYPPKKMQMKIAKALIQWFDEQIYTFEDLPLETNYSNEVGLLTQRYSTLWAMNVFLNPEKIEYIRLVESVCENLFEIRNESILHNYLKQRYSEYYESQNTMTEIKHRVIAREAPVIKSKVAIGLASETTKVEMTEQAYLETIEERKSAKSKQVKPKKQKHDENNEVMGFKDN